MVLKGYPFTWVNNQEDNLIEERIDRLFATPHWSRSFPYAVVNHIASLASDHCPIVINCKPPESRRRSKKRPFRFEAMWLRDPSCESLIKSEWENGRC